MGKVRAEFSDAVEPPPPQGADGEIEIGLRVQIEFHRVIDEWEIAASLEPHHIWHPEEIQKRFESDDAPGISLAFVRIFRLQSPWRFPNAKSYGGCRSWIDLPEAPSAAAAIPVLTDEAHRNARERILALVG